MSTKEKVGIIYNDEHVLHSTPVKGYLEQPERLIRIIRYLKKVGVFKKDCILDSDFRPASMEDILKVHKLDYLRFIKSYCDHGGGFLGDSTYFTSASFNTAVVAAGGAIEALRMVYDKKFSSSFALIRPPGHHASSDKFSGFCILNNAAIAVQYLIQRRNLDRIMIIDWDAHAANGTMSIFYDNPHVLLVSIHQDPTEFYPRDGFAHQIGSGQGKGTTINIEMPEKSGDEEYRRVFEEIVMPVHDQFGPEFVMGCCGFDAHWSDTSSKMMLTTDGYHHIVSTIRKRVGSLAILLEGGYNSKYNGQLALTVIKALLNQKNEITEEVSKFDVKDELDNKITRLKKVLFEFYEL